MNNKENKSDYRLSIGVTCFTCIAYLAGCWTIGKLIGSVIGKLICKVFKL